MKILMLTHEYPPYPGGVGRYCASLAGAAARAGHQITVLGPDHGQPVQAIEPQVKELRFSGDVFHLRELKSYREQVAKAVAAAPNGYDIIHAADWPAIMALRGMQTGNARLVATLHGSDVLLLSQSWRARLNLSWWALGRFDTLLCNSAYTRSLLAQHFPRLLSRAVITPLGVDEHWFEPAAPEQIASYQQRIGHRSTDLVVLTVARLDSRKGQLRTIEALSKLPDHLKQRVNYVCVGKEVEAGYCQQLEHAAKASNVRLTLTGRLPDGELKAAYGCAHTFALTGVEAPGKVEGFGLVLLEAAAQGLPAVVTRLQAMPEVVSHGHTGWVAEPKDLTDAFTQALTHAGQAHLRNACIAHAREFSWVRCMQLSYDLPPMSAQKAVA